MGRDLTGSGKTLAYSLPLIERMRKEKRLGNNKLKAICLCPTRELAVQVSHLIVQVSEVINSLKHHDREFKVITVYGGVPIDQQIKDLRYGVDIFVGTTGRVLDHVQRGNIDFSLLECLILDEADRMLQMGFKEDIEAVTIITLDY